MLKLNLFIFFAVCFFTANAQESIIQQKTESYVEAFNKRDAKKLASLWAEDGEYINPETGEIITGRDEIEKAFEERFQLLGSVQLEAKIKSITFPSEKEALEIGTLRASIPGKKPIESAFKVFFENQNGNWLISAIRLVDIEEAPNHFQHLKDLSWLIGDWIDEDEDVEIQSSYKWDSSKNFIYETFSVTTEGSLELEGTQIIGWDPVKKTIRSWLFDTDGTFGESIWVKKGNAWVIESAQTLADGRQASAIHVYTPIDQNSYTMESSGREVGSQLLPNIDPITIKRKNGR